MQEWERLAVEQDGIIARRQLLRLGIDDHRVRNQLRARRWTERTPRVLSTFTGRLDWRQRSWVGVLHAGGPALLGGLTALEHHGLRGWHRDEVTVLVDDELAFEPVAGVRFFRTRRPLPAWRCTGTLPLCRPEPAALLFAGYERSSRTAQGVLAAVVQQKVSTAPLLADELVRMRPLRRATLFRGVLEALGAGAQSLAEIDLGRLCERHGLPAPRRQRSRRDTTGRLRYTDAEWLLQDGRTLVLEIDGAFHMDVEHWEDDIARQRQLSARDVVLIRCTARELRDTPFRVLKDLQAFGLCA